VKRTFFGVLAILVLLVAASTASAAIKITTIRFDPPGADTGSSTSLKAEWIRLKNTGPAAKSLNHWTIRDASNHIYRFGAFTLRPGKSVTIHTGAGADGPANVYWNQDNYVWNNDGDTARLRDSHGTLKQRCSYSGSGSSATC
jgi:P pilus assembly chaperone PapD